MFATAARDSEAITAPRWRGVALAACLGLSLASRGTSADVDDTVYFTIDAPQLSSALIQLSQQSGLAIMFSDRLIRNLPAPDVVGTVSTGEALDALLVGSNLTWELIDERIIAVYAPDCTDGNNVACVAPQDMISKFPVYMPGMEETYVYGTQITGSRILRTGYTGGAPVDILSSPDIELSGAQTLGELLKFVPAVSGNATSTAISNGGDGTATVTLRGLPASNTLVLINGRRVANDGLAGESVDLNSIPPAAVERIEILKDGASAIYGSDAIAGVVNIIMKREFHGFLAEAFYGQAEQGDLETRNVNLQYGTGLPDGSFFISASFYDQDPIYARDRDISASADTRTIGGSDQRSSATPDARVVLPGGQTLIANEGGFRPATSEDLYNFQESTTAVVPLERASLYTNASYDFNESVTAFVEASYVDTKATAGLAPTPVFTAFEQTPLVVSADSIYNPFGTDITDVRRRLVELPVREQRNEAEVTRFSAVVEGLFDQWNWDFAYNWSRSEATETSSSIVNADRLSRAIGPSSGCRGPEIDGCVPVDLMSIAGSISPDQAEYIAATGAVSGYSKLNSGAFNLSGVVGESRHGKIDLAFGLEYRAESTSKRPSALFASANTIGATNFQATRGERTITELYMETLVPAWRSGNGLQSVDLEAALRVSKYNDFGSSTNPKVALRWQMGPELLLRANYASGFRAPSLNELYGGVTEEQAFLNDPCTLPANVGELPGCQQLADGSRNQFLTIRGGNSELDPETSDSYSLGLVATPRSLQGFSFSADYFVIEQEDVVASSAQFIINQNARFGSFADRVQRDQMGNLTLVEANNLNIGERKVSGADFALTWHLPKRTRGQLSLIATATWIREYLARLDSQAPELDLAGTFRDEASEGLGGIPKWKSQLGLVWKTKKWKGSYQIHHVDQMEELIPGTNDTREIDSWVVHDVQVNYRFELLRGLRMTLGIDNLFDEKAPLAASGFNDNIDGRTHELKGRYYYTKLSQRF